DTDLETYWNGPLAPLAGRPAGYNADLNDKSTMTFRENFTGFWNMWKARFITRDYALLDEIHPNRIKTAEEWFRREDKLGRELGKGSLWERIQPDNWSAAVAGQLAAQGFGEGSVLAVMLPNRVELVVVMLAAWRLGGIATPVNSAFTAAEAEFQINDCDAHLVVNESPE